jgi:hypothetical protein
MPTKRASCIAADAAEVVGADIVAGADEVVEAVPAVEEAVGAVVVAEADKVDVVALVVVAMRMFLAKTAIGMYWRRQKLPDESSPRSLKPAAREIASGGLDNSTFVGWFVQEEDS